MKERLDHTELLMMRYKVLMEEAYNLREVDPALSDYDYYEGMKLRSFIEMQQNLKFRIRTIDLLD